MVGSILAITITQSGSQAISATPSMAGGTRASRARVVIMTATHVGMGANASMFQVGANTLLAVPLNNGRAGGEIDRRRSSP